MMKFQCVYTLIITATFTFATFMGNSHLMHLLATGVNGINEILAAIFVTALVFSHVVT